MEEIWRPVVGYEGLYEVSNYGNVYSVKRECVSGNGGIQNVGGHCLPLNKWKGYLRVTLCKNGVQKNFSVHRVVAEAFISNPNNYPVINHKDENKTNNFVFVNQDGSIDPDKSNLEWCSYSYNMSYGEGAKNRALSNSKPILMLSLEGKPIRKFKSATEAGLFINNCFSPHINCCANGKRKTAYGYKWEWA